ncbi:hypothetical protein [uncultured Microbacterium sp.]|uniref:hypothetical protein n=1 Tax=uncultured Microbacterium sp. TaxID=191216 RepID=UPI0028F130D6|nr:hypothetical protein [uncultured Microbacterium sp.]
MTTRDALEDRKNALERELTRRQAKSNSERQAALVTRADDDVEDRDDAEREPAYGDDSEHRGRGDSTSRRQAARVTRGASRRGGS